jgi:hypothetical protein
LLILCGERITFSHSENGEPLENNFSFLYELSLPSPPLLLMMSLVVNDPSEEMGGNLGSKGFENFSPAGSDGSGSINILVPENNDTISTEDITDEWLCLHYDPTLHHLAYDEDEEGQGQEGLLTYALTRGKRTQETLVDQKVNGSEASQLVDNGSRLTCNRSWDRILCWPETYEGSSATLPCFSHLNGIPYDTSSKFGRINLFLHLTRMYHQST